jgi:hypothetical protein
MGEMQERKLPSITNYLLPDISHLSLIMESGFLGELTTVLNESFSQVINLPVDRMLMNFF